MTDFQKSDPYNYGIGITANLAKNQIELSAVLNLLDNIILTISPEDRLYNALSLLRLDYATLRKGSKVSCDPLLYKHYSQSKKLVCSFLRKEKRRLKLNEAAVVDVILENYHFTDEAYKKCGFGGMVKRLFRNPSSL